MTVLQQDRIDFTMMYVTHHAFQRDLDRPMAAAAAGKGGSATVSEGWENSKAHLLLHHSDGCRPWPSKAGRATPQPPTGRHRRRHGPSRDRTGGEGPAVTL